MMYISSIYQLYLINNNKKCCKIRNKKELSQIQNLQYSALKEGLTESAETSKKGPSLEAETT